MKYEGDVNYAADPYGYRPPEAPKRRGLLGLGLAVAGIVAFAGAILVSYRGSDRMSADGTPPLLTADATPAKSRPEQPGGLEVPHQDKLVFDRLHEKGDQPKIERLLPPPETPLPRPVVTPSMPPPPPLPAAPSIAQMPPPPPGSTATVPREMAAAGAAQSAAPQSAAPQPAAAPQATGKPAPQPAKPAPAPQQQAAAPAAKPVIQQTAPQTPQAAKPQPVATAALPPPTSQAAPAPQPGKPAATPAAVTPPKPDAKAAGGSTGWRVQLASVRSEAEAAAEWKRLQGKYSDALGGVGMQVVKADLGEKGVFYRVQGGGLDENRAKSVCAQLRAQSVGCVVVRP